MQDTDSATIAVTQYRPVKRMRKMLNRIVSDHAYSMQDTNSRHQGVAVAQDLDEDLIEE